MKILLQCRSKSTRLPKKCFAEVQGVSLLERIYDTCQSCGPTYLMLPYRSEDPEIFQYCRSRDWKVWEGSMDNVLDRYASFVRNDEGDDREQYARITADCPLLPRTLLTSMIDYAESKPMDYLTNRPWAIDGWDVEIFSKRLILGLDRVLPADSPDREHVLSYMNHMDQTQPGFVWPCHPIWCEQFDGESVKFSVDTKEDLEYIERIV